MVISQILNFVNSEVTTKLAKSLEKQKEFQDVHLVLYTDGGCMNTGDKVGGWGVHGYFYNEKPTKSNSGCKGYTPTSTGYTYGKTEDKVNVLSYLDFFGGLPSPSTNNIAELHALAAAFEIALLYPIKSITIYMDSDYVRLGLTEYMPNWTRNNWCNSQGKPVANKDYWIELDYLYSQLKSAMLNDNSITLARVDGHSGDKGNDRADELATAGAWGLRNYPLINSECFRMEEPNIWFNEKTLSPMFTEGRLFFNEEAIHEPGNYYYQSNLPYTGSELNRSEMIGKRASDLIMSVIKLNKTEHTLDALMNYAISHRQMTGVFKSRLDLLSKVDNYQHLELYPDGRYLVYDDKGDIRLPNKGSGGEDKAPVLSVISKPRLAFNLFGEYENLKTLLNSFINDDKTYNLQKVDITHYMYTKVLKNEKSEELVNKFNSDLLDNIKIPVTLEHHPEFDVNLTFGINLPSKANLARLKDINPVVYLIINPISSYYITHYTIIQTDDGIGIWCSPYSNEILLSK